MNTKKPYQAPQLHSLGSVGELTKTFGDSGWGSPRRGGGGHPRGCTCFACGGGDKLS